MVYLLTPQREIRFVCFYEIVDLNKFRACVSKSDRLSSVTPFSSEYSNIFNSMSCFRHRVSKTLNQTSTLLTFINSVNLITVLLFHFFFHTFLESIRF